MFRDVMMNAGLVVWPLFSLVLFFLSMTFVVVWIYRKNSKKFYDSMSLVVLDEGNNSQEINNESR